MNDDTYYDIIRILSDDSPDTLDERYIEYYNSYRYNPIFYNLLGEIDWGLMYHVVMTAQEVLNDE